MSDLAKIVDDLSKLTVLEAAELAKMLEEKWGVSAAAPVAFAPGAAAAGGAAAPAAVEQTEFTVILKSGGDKKLNVIKEVRSIISGLGIKEAKELVEAGNKTIKEGVSKEEAAKLKKQLEDQGAVVEIKYPGDGGPPANRHDIACGGAPRRRQPQQGPFAMKDEERKNG